MHAGRLDAQACLHGAVVDAAEGRGGGPLRRRVRYWLDAACFPRRHHVPLAVLLGPTFPSRPPATMAVELSVVVVVVVVVVEGK